MSLGCRIWSLISMVAQCGGSLTFNLEVFVEYVYIRIYIYMSMYERTASASHCTNPNQVLLSLAQGLSMHFVPPIGPYRSKPHTQCIAEPEDLCVSSRVTWS